MNRQFEVEKNPSLKFELFLSKLIEIAYLIFKQIFVHLKTILFILIDLLKIDLAEN